MLRRMPSPEQTGDCMRQFAAATTRSLLIALHWHWLIATTTSTWCVQGDPLNLVSNGNFEQMGFTLWQNIYGVGMPMLEVVSGTAAAVGALPDWRVVGGGVQVLSNTQYASSSPASSFLVHLNSLKAGPGILRTVPLSTPRANTLYNLTFSVAVNPDGGPPSRTLNVTVIRKGLPAATLSPSPVLSSSSTYTRSYLVWKTYSLSFVGNNRNTYIEFASCTTSNYGLLLDDVQVSLVDLISDGGFDHGSFNSTELSMDGYTLVYAPSTAITGWFVSAGSVKYSKGHYIPSDALLSSVVDLNGKAPGVLTTTFASRQGLSYDVLFDFAANPEAPSTSFSKDQVAFFVTVMDSAHGTILSDQAVAVPFVPNQSDTNITWQTGISSFVAIGDYTNLTFISQVSGSFGALLDNVHILEKISQTNSNAMASGNSSPSNSTNTAINVSKNRGKVACSLTWDTLALLFTCIAFPIFF